MARMWVRWGCGVLALAALGCGSEENPSNGKAGSGSGGATGTAGAGGTAGSNPSGGGGSASGAAGKSPGVLDCSGSFGPPTPVMPDETTFVLASPTLSPDALELIYVRIDGELATFQRSTRATVNEVFPVGTALPALDAVCAPTESRSADLSADGLRVYVTCYSSIASPVGPAQLHVAQRTTLNGEFDFQPTTRDVGPSASISRDELTLYGSSEVDIGAYPPRQFVRADVNDFFDQAQDIPGLEQTNMTAPDVSPDGLTITGGLQGALVSCTRSTPSDPFGPPTTLVAAATPLDAMGAPESSQDCRSLLYIHQNAQDLGVLTAQFMMMKR